MRITNKNIFWIYFSFFILLALWFHKDVLFNLYNYGRHWDWTFYPISGLYKHYIDDFFTAIKPNSLGYVDILSVSIGEFTTKLIIYILSQISMRVLQLPVSVPLLNKITVFVILPLISTIGMWHLCKRILQEIYHTDKRFFLIVAAFVNIVYTFSLVLIFDLHGGALNRQLSSAIFPWFFLILYDYYESTIHKYLDYHIVLMGLLFIVFDISNIFYAGVLIFIATMLKRISWKYKVVHLAVLGIFIIGVNAFWLQGLFIGSSINKTEILKERKTEYATLASYSVPYRDIFSMLNTPHNLANVTFGTSILKYVPYVSVYIIVLILLVNTQVFKHRKRLAFFFLISYLFTTMLATGVFSIGGLYSVLYSISILGFIRSAVRYMPNLAIFTVLVLIIVLKISALNKTSISQKYYALFVIPLTLWTLFLLLNGHMISLVVTNVVKSGDINHEIGALYSYDASVYESTNNEELLYNIIPVPSWFSPVFIDNVYPKTSQGSDTDNAYLSKGSIMTYGLPTFSSEFLEMFINSQAKPFFFASTNTRHIWFKNQKTVNQLTEDLYFSKNWALKTFGNISELRKAYKQHDLYTLSDNYFLPRIYVPDTIITTSKPVLYMPSLIDTYGDHIKTAFIFTSQNNAKNISTGIITKVPSVPTVEFKQISPSKYRIRIHGAIDSFTLVASIPYNDDWSLYLMPFTHHIDTSLLSTYNILQGNEQTQVPSEDLRAYINNGWVSTLGDGRVKQKLHMGYNNNMEYIKSREPYTISYISKEYYGSIQNNNLPNGHIFEPWTDNPVKIDASKHLTANGFSNAWDIPLLEICNNSTYCTKTDRGYDAEFIMVYDPQKNYMIGLIISGIFICLSIIFCTHQMMMKRNKNHEVSL